LNGLPITVNKENLARNVTVSYFCNYVTPVERITKFRTRISSLGIRRYLDLWAPAFCYCKLASGLIEGIINDKIELYDYAAGKLIAAEAGAKITDFSGNNIDDDTCDVFVVTNGTSLHDLLVDNVTKL
jgi:fructose-1,6-bisphosphatase/inositol monophosphatase family enzyme